MEYLKEAFENYFSGLKKLRTINVLPNSKDFTGQLGEWIVESLYDGVRSKNGIQQDWDVELKDGKKIQVKSHAKGINTKARWSNLKKNRNADIDIVIIIIFDSDYRLKEFYEIPWEIAYDGIRVHKDADRIFWDDFNGYLKIIDDLDQEIISIFR